jgi:hypothetical protein
MPGMNKFEIQKLVNRYIGVAGGYLGDFSYRSHQEFYQEYCDLDIDPDEFQGTTRERFLRVLSRATPRDQAKIIRGILEKYPAEADHDLRTHERAAEFLEIAERLEGVAVVGAPAPAITTRAVETAIADVTTLIEKRGATSGVDRVHTALHGYLHEVCRRADIQVPGDATTATIFSQLRQHHPALQEDGPRAQDITKVFRGLATIIDALSPIRNKASIAHPSADLLEAPEAMLVINATQSALHYLDAKLGEG